MHAALVSYAIMDALWKHPFTCIVAGPTGCGKSTFVTRMLPHAAAMIDPPPEQITWCYGEWQEAYATTDLGHVRFEEGLPTAAMFDSTTRNLIVIDDLMAETDERVTTLFTKKSHHRNTSVLYLVQNLFPKNKESRTISLNSQYMVVFKNPRDASQMANLARQMYPGRGKFVQEAFKDATSVPYGYLLVDLKQDTPEDMRLRTARRRCSVRVLAEGIKDRTPDSSLHSHHVCSREETHFVHTDSGQVQEQQSEKGHHRQRRRPSAVCTSRVCLQHTNKEQRDQGDTV